MLKSTTLMLTALAALTLGAGAAMADGSGGGPDYWSRQNMKAIQSGATNPSGAAPIPSGSSDVEQDTGADHSAQFILQHHLYGAGGVAG